MNECVNDGVAPCAMRKVHPNHDRHDSTDDRNTDRVAKLLRGVVQCRADRVCSSGSEPINPTAAVVITVRMPMVMSSIPVAHQA